MAGFLNQLALQSETPRVLIPSGFFVPDLKLDGLSGSAGQVVATAPRALRPRLGCEEWLVGTRICQPSGTPDLGVGAGFASACASCERPQALTAVSTAPRALRPRLGSGLPGRRGLSRWVFRPAPTGGRALKTHKQADVVTREQ
jgi:hypothetical protein